MKFRPWMIQTAHEFIRTGRLTYEHELYNASLVNTGLGVEVLFKSFLAETGNVRGGIEETHIFDKKKLGLKGHGHNLVALLDLVPEDLRERLGFERHRDDIQKYYPQPFLTGRYPYEDDGPGSYSDHIVELAENMVNRTIAEYQKQGCSDPWIRDQYL